MNCFIEKTENNISKDNTQYSEEYEKMLRMREERIRTSVKKSIRGAVDRRLRRYYLIVRLLPNVFVLACLSLGSI